MIWRVEFSAKAERQFGKLDKQTQQEIVSYLDWVLQSDDPQQCGKPLVAEWSGFWRYRVGKYRIICDIQRQKLLIEIITVDKRDKVYQ